MQQYEASQRVAGGSAGVLAARHRCRRPSRCIRHQGMSSSAPARWLGRIGGAHCSHMPLLLLVVVLLLLLAEVVVVLQPLRRRRRRRQ